MHFHKVLLLLISLCVVPSVAVLVELNSAEVNEFCSTSLNCSYGGTQMDGNITKAELLKNVNGIATLVFVYDVKLNQKSLSGSLQGRGSNVAYSVHSSYFVVTVGNSSLTDGGIYECQITTDLYGNITESSSSSVVNVTASTHECGVMCKNGASCTNGCSTYKCFCTFNWQGTNCDQVCDIVQPLPSTTNIFLGDNITMSCISNASSASVYWSSDSLGTTRLSTGVNLTLTSAALRDQGVYYCFANNGICTSSTATLVHVIWDVPPTTSTTVAMKLNEGDRLDLVCNVSTQPVPLLYWQFNPTPRFEMVSCPPPPPPSPPSSLMLNDTSDNTTDFPCVPFTIPPTTSAPKVITNVSLGSVELDIVSVTEADDGNYTCIAQLPGPQLFRIMAYSVSIVKKNPDDVLHLTSTSSSRPWVVGLAVGLVVGFLVIALIIAIVLYFKYKEKFNKGSQVEPEGRPEKGFAEGEHNVDKPSTEQNGRRNPSRQSMERPKIGHLPTLKEQSLDLSYNEDEIEGRATKPEQPHGRKLPPLRKTEVRNDDEETPKIRRASALPPLQNEKRRSSRHEDDEDQQVQRNRKKAQHAMHDEDEQEDQKNRKKKIQHSMQDEDDEEMEERETNPRNKSYSSQDSERSKKSRRKKRDEDDEDMDEEEKEQSSARGRSRKSSKQFNETELAQERRRSRFDDD